MSDRRGGSTFLGQRAVAQEAGVEVALLLDAVAVVAVGLLGGPHLLGQGALLRLVLPALLQGGNATHGGWAGGRMEGSTFPSRGTLRDLHSSLLHPCEVDHNEAIAESFATVSFLSHPLFPPPPFLFGPEGARSSAAPLCEFLVKSDFILWRAMHYQA